jgi:two-component system OmpR family sensor kinase
LSLRERRRAIKVRGEARALRILVRNLVDNAVRYTPPGGTVRVSCRAEDDGGVLLRGG